MEYSGPASMPDLDADLALSDDDTSDEHWPPMELHTPSSGPTPWQPQVDVPPLPRRPPPPPSGPFTRLRTQALRYLPLSSH